MRPDDVRRALGEHPLPAPEARWSAIRAALTQPDGGVASGAASAGRALRRAPRRVSLPLAIAAGLGAVILGVGAGTYRQFAAPTRWIATGPTAQVRDSAWLDTAWLETAADTARFAVGRIGTVALAPGARARLVRGAWNEHRLELTRGAMHAVIAAPPRLFFVQTPSALATDLGCAYDLAVSPDGGTTLRVTVGWVELAKDDARSLVPAGLSAHVSAEGRPSVPYEAQLPEAAQERLAALAQRELPDSSASRALAELLVMLDDADDGRPANINRQTTGITLWHLLQRVSPAQRPTVLAALERRGARPAGVTTEGILALDRQMLDRWRRALHPMWGEDASPLIAIAQRVWLSLMD